jgi:DNA-binding HxlR family transcriptional regulator
VADYGKYCPIALASEVVADRWTPLILRELVLGNTRFNDIARCLPGISRSLLVQRLKHLERKGVVERWPLPTGRGHEYRLTPAGKDLEPVLISLGRWAIQWLYDDLEPHEVDPVTLTWWMHRRIDHANLPPGRTVIQFDHTTPQRLSIWMVLDRGQASVCVQHPGFDPDVLVTTTTPALAEVFQGYTPWDRAVAGGSITLDGAPRLTRAFPRWFLWSPFHDDTVAMVEAVGALPGG